MKLCIPKKLGQWWWNYFVSHMCCGYTTVYASQNSACTSKKGEFYC